MGVTGFSEFLQVKIDFYFPPILLSLFDEKPVAR